MLSNFSKKRLKHWTATCTFVAFYSFIATVWLVILQVQIFAKQAGFRNFHGFNFRGSVSLEPTRQLAVPLELFVPLWGKKDNMLAQPDLVQCSLVPRAFVGVSLSSLYRRPVTLQLTSCHQGTQLSTTCLAIVSM